MYVCICTCVMYMYVCTSTIHSCILSFIPTLPYTSYNLNTKYYLLSNTILYIHYPTSRVIIWWVVWLYIYNYVVSSCSNIYVPSSWGHTMKLVRVGIDWYYEKSYHTHISLHPHTHIHILQHTPNHHTSLYVIHVYVVAVYECMWMYVYVCSLIDICTTLLAVAKKLLPSHVNDVYVCIDFWEHKSWCKHTIIVMLS